MYQVPLVTTIGLVNGECSLVDASKDTAFKIRDCVADTRYDHYEASEMPAVEHACYTALAHAKYLDIGASFMANDAHLVEHDHNNLPEMLRGEED